MWPGKKKQAPIRSLVCEGTVIEGTLRFIDGVRIDGEIIGDVIAAESGHSIVVISEKARVQGMVKADHVIINGEVQGPIHCTELLELQPKARVTGDVKYEMLEMHQGALIDGEMRPLKFAEKPALKLAASNET